VTIFQVGERVEPAAPTATSRILREARGRGPADAREARDHGHAAGEYAGRLPESFSDQGVAHRHLPGRDRMTLTCRVLERARNVLWLTTGADKVDAVTRLRAGDHAIPADWICTADAPVTADEATAGGASR
jgi:hypothetical protein